jgi:hypothetical protein
MREAKVAPSIQAFDQKAAAAAAAAARKALTSVQTLPKGVEVLDPLGLGVMDNKSLRLITDASVSSPVSREKSQGLDPNLRGMPDDFIGISSCTLFMPAKMSILHFCRQSCIFVSKF